MRHQYRYTFNLRRANERYDNAITALYCVGGYAALAQVTDYLEDQRKQARLVAHLERHGLAVRRTIAPPKNRGMYVALTSMGINRIAEELDAKRIAYVSTPGQQRLVTSFSRFGYYARYRTFARPLSEAIPSIAARGTAARQKHISDYGNRLVGRYTALVKQSATPAVIAERQQIRAEHEMLQTQWPTVETLTATLQHHLNIRSLYIDLDDPASGPGEVCYVYVDQGNSPGRYQKLMSKLSASVVTIAMTARLRVLVDCPHRLGQLRAVFNRAAKLNEKVAENDRYLSERITVEPIELGIARYFAHMTELPELFSEEEAAVVQAVLERRS